MENTSELFVQIKLDHNFTITNNFFFIVLQGVADAHCKFLTIDVGAMGKQSDGGVFRNSDSCA